MKIVVLMAGEGKRFTDVYGQDCYKPFVEVNGKTILEWTLSSIPEIQKFSVDFVIQAKHEKKFQVIKRLRQIFSSSLNYDVLILQYPTQGNLETAYLFNNYYNDSEEDILFLDSDNYYDGSKLISFIENKKKENGAFCLICGFEPLDDSAKWCFMEIGPRENEVKGLYEKDVKSLKRGGKPMVGVFYFSDRKRFNDAARQCFNKQQKTGNEFYLSSAVLNYEGSVYGLIVDKVIPLGTPEDVGEFQKIKNNKKRICIDLDGTICYTRQNNESYEDVLPLPDAVKTIQTLKNQGFTIIIATSRHMKTCGGNVGEIMVKQGGVILDWLKKHNIPCDELYLGKPLANYYIDDKAIKFESWLEVKNQLLN